MDERKSQCFQGLAKNILEILEILRMSWASSDAADYSHKETLNFTLLIYMHKHEQAESTNPKRAEDFEDFEDIFMKASNSAGLLDFGCEDISEDIFVDEDFDADASSPLACALDKGSIRYYTVASPDSELRLSSESWQ